FVYLLFCFLLRLNIKNIIVRAVGRLEV
ncbi:TioA protein, partial [Salmonella enterica]|nr:TioA protein [Salmonella enterica subsp. enterica serovar Johannesburg]EBD6769176.1 TioA protein [Salmonella enterica subsp. enterica serovar Johannesburg]EBJ2415141.1 TioA protein [Salmonella enterica subsp. enterica serovar Johannesburg]EBY9144423.1 TioA protein [Salmonella enterica subsp. enterica serovar Mbandaka]EDY4459405.1 TioA protein [Salmonella enterica subsp. enterica]